MQKKLLNFILILRILRSLNILISFIYVSPHVWPRKALDDGQECLAEPERDPLFLLQLVDVLVDNELVLAQQVSQLQVLAPQCLELVC